MKVSTTVLDVLPGMNLMKLELTVFWKILALIFARFVMIKTWTNVLNVFHQLKSQILLETPASSVTMKIVETVMLSGDVSFVRVDLK